MSSIPSILPREPHRPNPMAGPLWVPLLSAYLGHPEPVVRLLHGLPGVLHRLVGVPGLPVRAKAWRDGGGK